MQRTKSIFNTFRQKTNIIIYGTNTASGRFFDLVLLGVILVSIVIVMLETVKGIDTKYHNELIVLEWVITIFFTIEYILRVISIKKPLKYIFSFYGIIDLIATIPMYFSLFFCWNQCFNHIKSFTTVTAIQNFKTSSILQPIHTSQRSHDC